MGSCRVRRRDKTLRFVPRQSWQWYSLTRRRRQCYDTNKKASFLDNDVEMCL